MSPQPDHLDGPLGIVDLVHQPMLDVDPARIGSGEVRALR
jgi:hypothetical protein